MLRVACAIDLSLGDDRLLAFLDASILLEDQRGKRMGASAPLEESLCQFQVRSMPGGFVQM